MPFSAPSPERPVSLLGADAATVEGLRSRNRRQARFSVEQVWRWAMLKD